MKEWIRKPKVLVVGDSSVIHTGFAKVVKEVTTHLYNTDNYEIETIGWFHRQSEEIVAYPITRTKADNREQMEADKYAHYTFPEVVDKFKPDIVIAVGDSWMVDHIAVSPHRAKYKLLMYVPIDGMPIPKKWTVPFSKADKLVAYGQFGEDVIRMRKPDMDNIVQINHGVDIDTFKPLTEEEKLESKKMFGSGTNFIVGCIARNQPRKNLPRLFKAASMFLSGWTACEDCGDVGFTEAEQCNSCKSENLYHGHEKTDARFYLHMALNDCGWDIYELIDRFNLKGKVAYPKGLQVGKGVEVSKLAEIMGSLDVFTLPTSGEGWGLPILEAMSCGLPVVVTDYSAHVDFCAGATELIRVSEFVTEPMTNIERALVDIYDYCMRLDKLYYDDSEIFMKKWGWYFEQNGISFEDGITTGKEWREKLGKEARLRAEKFSWKRVCGEWEDLVNQELEYVPSEAKIEKTKKEYDVEEL